MLSQYLFTFGILYWFHTYISGDDVGEEHGLGFGDVASHLPPRLSIIGHSELRMIPIKRAIGKYLFDSYDARKKEIVTSLRDTDQILYRVPIKHIGQSKDDVTKCVHLIPSLLFVW